MIGRSLAHYEVTAHLGAGGMGEVYRARDGKLGRDVAIKLLPDAFASDTDRLARFEREARLLASLSHPSVAAIYGLEESDGRRFLVLELAEGETLAEKIARGPVATEEAIEIALQIADALEAAHDKGIVHRDLKPANVKLSGDGRVKVLDFGLAKALAGDDSGESDVASFATLSRDATRAGVILGTPAYMSPEQARGKPVDRRADIWAFGVVLHEMLTGKALFRGETVTDTVAEVLKTDFDWAALPHDLPPSLLRLLRRCLERDPRRRMRDAGDVRLELEAARDEEPEAAAPLAAAPTAAPRRPIWRGLALHAGVLLLAIVAASQLVPEWARRGAARGLPLRRFEVPASELGRFRPAISPDGARIAFASDGQLFVRDLDKLETRELGGENVTVAFWSWNSAWLAYGAGARLYKVPADGTDTPVAIADLTGVGFAGDADGGAWLRDDTILFATGGDGLYRVPARGGDPELELPLEEGEVDFHAVHALPGGEGALLIVHLSEGRRALIAYRGGRRHPALELPGQQIFNAAYSTTGHVVYDRAQGGEIALWAVPFSLDELRTEGEPFLVARGAGRPATADDGTLVYVRDSGRPERELIWITSDGEREALPSTAGLRDPALSPDGSRVAFSAELDGKQDVWVADLANGARARVTVDGARNFAPEWFPDGTRIAYECAGAICIAPADGTRPGERLIEGFHPHVGPDGRQIVFAAWGVGTRSDLWTVDPTDPDNRQLLLSTPANEMQPRISPDGRFLAYRSDETGRPEVYLRELGEEGRRWQVSQGGGTHPRWSPEGDALCFASGRNSELWSVSVAAGPAPRLGAPVKLFDWRGSVSSWYDVAPGGEGYYALRWIRRDPERRGLVVAQGWYQEFAEESARRAE